MNQSNKQSMMIISGNNMGEYNEVRKLSVEDFLIRLKLYVDSIAE